jgi:hypothetical protein
MASGASARIEEPMNRPELLLHPQIPKPLHGCAPRVILGEDWWNRERQAAYAANDFCCWACGVPKADALIHQWLEGHECYEFDYAKGRLTLKEIVALCHLCHNFIHLGRLGMLLKRGETTHEFILQVIDHGRTVTKGLKAPALPKISAPWAAWRMVIDGKEYGPTSENYTAWSRGEWRKWKP